METKKLSQFKKCLIKKRKEGQTQKQAQNLCKKIKNRGGGR